VLEADRETPTQIEENKSVKERTFAREDIRYFLVLSRRKNPEA
jgi:hypothetical protein